MIEYIPTFLLLILFNIIPILTPPNWLILSFVYNTNKALDPIVLAFVGALATTIGCYILAMISKYFKQHFMNKKYAKKTKELGKLARKNPLKAFFVMLGLSSITPFPSSAIFIIVGMSEASTIPIYLAFFIGRFLQYFVLIISTNYILTSIADVFNLSLTSIIIFDLLLVAILFVFFLVDWIEFIHTRKIKFIPLKQLFRRDKQIKHSK